MNRPLVIEEERLNFENDKDSKEKTEKENISDKNVSGEGNEDQTC